MSGRALTEARRLFRGIRDTKWIPETLTAHRGRFHLTVCAPQRGYPPSDQLGKWFWQVWRTESGEPVNAPDGEVASGRSDSEADAKLEAIRHCGVKAQREWRSKHGGGR